MRHCRIFACLCTEGRVGKDSLPQSRCLGLQGLPAPTKLILITRNVSPSLFFRAGPSIDEPPTVPADDLRHAASGEGEAEAPQLELDERVEAEEAAGARVEQGPAAHPLVQEGVRDDVHRGAVEEKPVRRGEERAF
eukprot:CAMPEP_0172632532 /NCGR_PEP_ID=MMETSP1068-20121228/184933_1 /TAXON_ID=35684 /ORGANISM="Pseudopedinella elastica, Strain CCMP716" /LENGTH=135 /DNA_ID=CAMNT_0013443975 /DNA_START=72 /DNA_END=479 /DNA_ORIENTATION=-